MRAGIALGLSLGLILGPASTAHSAVQVDPEVQDVAGDANFLVTTLQSDTVTSPASYGAADLVSVDLQTTYDAFAVGDGVDYRPSALRAVFATSESPSALPPGGQIVFRVSTPFPLRHIEGIVTKSPAGVVSATARLRLGGNVGQCNAQPNLCFTSTRPEWTAQIDDARKTLTLTYPFSTFDPAERFLFGVDAFLSHPDAETVQVLYPNTIDSHLDERAIDTAPVGYGHIVGEDVPKDVGCTEECERTELRSGGGFRWSDTNGFGPLEYFFYTNGAGTDAESVDVALTITRCAEDGACTDTRPHCPEENGCTNTVLSEHCEGLKCGIRGTINYDPTEVASYWFVFKWEFDDGSSFTFSAGKPCHDGLLGLEECPDEQGKQLRF